MQANFILFRAPTSSNTDRIRKRIVLIPKIAGRRHLLLPDVAAMGNPDSLTEFFRKLSEKDCRPKQGSKDDKEGGKEGTVRQLLPTMKMDHKQEILGTKTMQQLSSPNKSGQLAGNQADSSTKEYIPCLFYRGFQDQIVLFFHANGEDLVTSEEFTRLLHEETGMSVLVMEYRGYSLYEGTADTTSIEADANCVVQYLRKNDVADKRIIIFGRSIGCAIALSLVSTLSPFCFVLLSPFFSLKKIARELYGQCAEHLLKDNLQTEEKCLTITCPLLLVHGLKDSLISYKHSQEILAACKSYSRLKIIEHMTHTKFHFHKDLIQPFKDFLKDIE